MTHHRYAHEDGVALIYLTVVLTVLLLFSGLFMFFQHYFGRRRAALNHA